MASNRYAKIQQKGQVTLPVSFREQYHLEKGDMVVFIETEAGILIKPAKLVLTEALDAMGEELRNKGVDLDTWLNLSEKSREETSHSEE